MVTTFERLAKILKGYVKPSNWIERAFAELASAIGSVLPSVSDSDRGKFLGVNSSNNNLSWKAIRQVPEVEDADKGKYLHANEDTGALEWSEAGGSGSGIQYFYVNLSTQDDITYTIDKTWEQLEEAYLAGKLLVCPGKGLNSILIYDADGYLYTGHSTNAFTGILRQVSIGLDDRTHVMTVEVTDFQCANGAGAN